MCRFIFLLILILLNTLTFAQGNFTVKGKFKNYDGKVYLMYDEQKDSVVAENGVFTFKGKVNKPADSYISIPYGKEIEFKSFWIDNGLTILELDTVPFKNSIFSGLTMETKVIKSGKTNQVIDSAIRYSTSIEARNISKEEKAQLIRVMVNSLLGKYPSSIMSLWVLSFNSQYYNDRELQYIYANLDPVLARHKIALAIKTKYISTFDVLLGAKLPNFTQTDQFGKLISLSSFKGKYVLIDFWASWCVPCRKENPAVVSAYQKYKLKGFDILAVSLDKSKEAWVKAIKDDGLTWSHVSDLGGWSNVVSKTFKITAVPANILIDKEGIVIAKNLRGEELEKKLAEIFNSK